MAVHAIITAAIKRKASIFDLEISTKGKGRGRFDVQISSHEMITDSVHALLHFQLKTLTSRGGG
jgi:hypothetical protein